LHIDEGGCRRDLTLIDATFSVLAPAEQSEKNEAGTLAEARWQTVELRTNTGTPKITTSQPVFHRNCADLEYVTNTVLPLSAARDVKLISNAICSKTGVGLRAEVLMPTQTVDRLQTGDGCGFSVSTAFGTAPRLSPPAKAPICRPGAG
jgi:hypothetical protein